MATSLTYGPLRQLARLYRSNVDGAADMLSAIIEEHVQELPELLGFPMQNLERLRHHENPVEVLVATIEGAPRVARGIRDRIHFESAASMAVRLAEIAERRPDGHCALDVPLLVEILARYPGRVVTFGTRGSCGALRLRAVVRELRGVRVVSIVVTNTHVVISYESERSRGLLRLVLHDPIIDAETLVVPLDIAITQVPFEVPPDQGTCAVRTSTHGRPSRHEDASGAILTAEPPSRAPETVLGHRRRSPAPVRRLAVRVLEALVAAALGAAP